MFFQRIVHGPKSTVVFAAFCVVIENVNSTDKGLNFLLKLFLDYKTLCLDRV